MKEKIILVSHDDLIDLKLPSYNLVQNGEKKSVKIAFKSQIWT